jgi:hypothetical protein
MDFREGQLVKTSTNRRGRTTILTLSKPCRRSGSMVTILGKERRYSWRDIGRRAWLAYETAPRSIIPQE